MHYSAPAHEADEKRTLGVPWYSIRQRLRLRIQATHNPASDNSDKRNLSERQDLLFRVLVRFIFVSCSKRTVHSH